MTVGVIGAIIGASISVVGLLIVIVRYKIKK